MLNELKMIFFGLVYFSASDIFPTSQLYKRRHGHAVEGKR